MYKYHIKIQGEKEPIILEGERGEKFKKAYDDNSIPRTERVNFGNDASYLWGEIRGVKRVYIEERTNDALKNIEEHNRRRNAFVRLSPEQKSEHLGLFKMFFQASKDRKPNDQEESRAKELQLEFYKSNANRRYPDPKIFDELIPRSGLQITMMGGLLLKYVGAMLNQDLQDSKYST